ncbi:hypothetical protein [Methylorubrum extorquens]|uniref:hypothetical protein n=1 Tax=Methylorubrum extorquens TaxID=408 RepID=UPI0009D71422
MAWVLGRREDATCRKLLAKTGTTGITFVTDDWDGYHRLIPRSNCSPARTSPFPLSVTTATSDVASPVFGAGPWSSPNVRRWSISA